MRSLYKVQSKALQRVHTCSTNAVFEIPGSEKRNTALSAVQGFCDSPVYAMMPHVVVSGCSVFFFGAGESLGSARLCGALRGSGG